MNLPRPWIAFVASMTVLSACSTNPKTTDESTLKTPAEKSNSDANVAKSAGAATAASTPESAPAAPPRVRGLAHREAGHPLATRSFFFDYDRFVIRSEFVPLLQRHAEYLRAQTDFAIQIHGHADERGSREYNLALAQKRAEAIRKALEALGVEPNRMEAVSFGEEKPKSPGHDEASWAENRRGELLYSGEF